MNKKGMTVVELIVSFSLTMVIVVFLIQIIINLSKIYDNNTKKTELLNSQAIISDSINTAFIRKQLVNVSDCGDDCYKFYYKTGDTDTLKLENGVLTFDNVAMKLKNATYGEIMLDAIYMPTIDDESNNALLILYIPIESQIDYNFDVRVVYSFNSYTSSLDNYFMYQGSNYLELKGNIYQVLDSETKYVEPGYTVYDKSGNVVSGNVSIESNLPAYPYGTGTYEIKYKLKDKSGNIISEITRSVVVEPGTYQITNMFVNGSFEDGFTGWNSNLYNKGGVTLSTTQKTHGNNSIYATPVNDGERAAFYTNSTIKLLKNHKYYFATDAFYESSPSVRSVLLTLVKDGGYTRHLIGDISVLYEWQKLSEIITVPIDVEYSDIRVGHSYGNSEKYEVYVDSVILIDLTEAFGAGREPSKEWCDENIKYFDGTISINY